MAFELQNQTATLKSVTPRKETHGDSRVSAVSLGLKFTAPNTLLDHLSPTLRPALYMPAVIEGQEPLEGVEVPTPLLRTAGIEIVSLKGTLEGWTLEVEHGIDEPMVFGGCKIDAFRVAPMQGGTVELHLRVGTNDIDAEELGLLCAKLAEEVTVSITAPVPMEAPIDGSVEAFKKDHPDLLDGIDSPSPEDALAHAVGLGGPGADDDLDDGEGSAPDAAAQEQAELEAGMSKALAGAGVKPARRGKAATA